MIFEFGYYANFDYIEHLDPDSVEDDELNPINRNFEELSFENVNQLLLIINEWNIQEWKKDRMKYTNK